MLLWAEFFFMVGDPTASGSSVGPNTLPFYTSWRGFIDWIYYAGDWACYPITIIYKSLYLFYPGIQTTWFPYLPANSITQSIESFYQANSTLPWPDPVKAFIKGPNFDSLLPGIFYWIPVVMVILLSVMNPILDHVVDFLKNVVWNVLIEFSFTKRKQAVYQEALEKRAEALVKLNTEYRNLSKEASQLKTSVITDELTQVYNKRFFLQKIGEVFAEAKRNQSVCSLIMMDIDHFKRLNDTYGHLMGDKVLQQVAQVAKNKTPGQCFCCRFGGEEFGVILPGKSYEAAMEVADAVRQSVPLLKFPEEANLRVTISQGLVTVNFAAPAAAPLEKFDDFIKLADDELYKAKLEGRDRVCSRKVE